MAHFLFLASREKVIDPIEASLTAMRQGFWEGVLGEEALRYVLSRTALPLLLSCFRAEDEWQPASFRVIGSSAEAGYLKTWLETASFESLGKLGRWALGAEGMISTFFRMSTYICHASLRRYRQDKGTRIKCLTLH